MEEWKSIEGYEGVYIVSNLGVVKSLSSIIQKNYKNEIVLSTIKEKIVNGSVNFRGYVSLVLVNNGVKKHCVLHRIVAQTFLPNIENLPEVNHKNGIKTDNRVSNLEWVSPEYNKKHAKDLGLLPIKSSMKKFSDEEIAHIKNEYNILNININRLAIKYNSDRRTIRCIVKGITYKHIV